MVGTTKRDISAISGSILCMITVLFRCNVALWFATLYRLFALVIQLREYALCHCSQFCTVCCCQTRSTETESLIVTLVSPVFLSRVNFGYFVISGE